MKVENPSMHSSEEAHMKTSGKSFFFFISYILTFDNALGSSMGGATKYA